MVDTTNSFVVGPELLARGRGKPDPHGPGLAGTTFAAKDVFDVVGLPTGAGTPDRRAEAGPAAANAWAVDALLAAGADLMGTTISDELAFSLSGTNVHDGTPLNPFDSKRVPGGSSAGSTTAVAHGLVDIALGTDTGGSIRVPASYCGVVGLRPTHGRVPVAGVVPLARQFDTVGLLTRDVPTMAAAWAGLTEQLPGGTTIVPSELVIADDLFALLDDTGDGLGGRMIEAAETLASDAGLRVRRTNLAAIVGTDLGELLVAFRSLQMHEIWAEHGRWIDEREPRLGPGIAARFEMARAVTDDEMIAAQPVRDLCRDRMRVLTAAGVVIAQPAASGAAPLIELDADAKNDMRRRTLELTAPAGLAGLPVISVPAASTDGFPVGLALIGGADGESSLIDLARVLPDVP